MNKPLISVIVPVYNVEKYLEECMKSILHQTYLCKVWVPAWVAVACFGNFPW